MKYDPNSLTDRRALGAALLLKMEETGFSRVEREGTHEAVFGREIPDTGITVLVYTSCNPTKAGATARSCGTDAIRVCAVYRREDGRERGVAKADKRVHRVGRLTDVVSRTHSRMREVWKLAATGARCSDCGAPKFLSRRKNLVCAEVCWSKTVAA